MDGNFGINSSFTGMEAGFGYDKANQLGELRKALSAGYQVSGQTQGGALRVQSLESSLKVLSSTQRHLKFWQEVPKDTAFSTVEEYNVLESYGADNGGFNFEGILPQQDDTTYTRKVALMKFLGTTRSVTHPMSIVRPAHGNVIALENNNGILWILRRLENAFFNGDATLMYNNAEGAEFSGLSKTINAANVIDMLGNPLSEEAVEEAAAIVSQAPNFAIPTHLFLSQRALADFSKTVYGKERFNPQQASVNSNGQVGYFVKSVNTQSGEIGVRNDVFITNTPNEPTVISANAPVAPATISAGSMTGSDGQWFKDGPGVYSYSATLGNNFGESAPSSPTTVTVTSADLLKHVPLTVTNGTVGTVLPQYVGIYRSVPNGAVRYRIARVPVSSQANSGTTVFNDKDTVMANTSEAYLGEMSQQVIAFKQLSPLSKMDLAITSPAFRWMLLLYGVLVLYADRKWCKFTNIGSSSAIATV